MKKEDQIVRPNTIMVYRDVNTMQLTTKEYTMVHDTTETVYKKENVPIGELYIGHLLK